LLPLVGARGRRWVNSQFHGMHIQT
jgi:hypothetical protein